MALAWRDGAFVEKSSITINPADFGFSRGIAVYEFTRVYGDVPFKLEDHLERLLHGAQIFGIACSATAQEMKQIVQRLCAENKFAHSTVKFFLTAGECAQYSAYSFAACDGFTPHLIITEDEFRPAHPEAPYGMEMYRRGQRLKTIPCARDFPTVKSSNYALGFHAARAQAGKEWDDILFTRADGTITEAARSNFFAVIDGVLCTPREGMLYGVTRKVVLELAAKLGLPAAERGITVADLAHATEAFTTGTTIELLPARQLDDHILTMTMDGPVFKKLRQAFTDEVARACAAAAPTAAGAPSLRRVSA